MNKKIASILASGALAMVIAGGSLKAWGEQEDKDSNEVKIALPADQLIASIRTAVAAKPGRVLETEAESEGGKTHCDVIVLGNDGKTYEVEVDIATNKVSEVELKTGKDDDNDEHEGKDDDH